MTHPSDKPNGNGAPVPGKPPAATAQVIAMSDLEAHVVPGGGRSPVTEALADAAHPLRRVKAKLTVCVGSVEVSIGELLEAQEQQVIRLDRTVEQPVDIMLEGQVVARGTLVAVDEHFAVRITELFAAADRAPRR